MGTKILDANKVYEILSALLPAKNDYYETDYKEELEELRVFNINTEDDLQSLIETHLETMIQIDEEPVDEYNQKVYSEQLGADFVKDALERKYWFAFPALLRLALELEFGDDYLDYSSERDSTD